MPSKKLKSERAQGRQWAPGGGRTYTCQWPNGCSFVATAQMKRGEDMKFLRLCTHHANQFMCMTNAECADTYKRRTSDGAQH